MRWGGDLLIACPFCSDLYTQQTLMSGNDRDARYWTDGKRDAPMLPSLPSLTRCGRCNTFFHIDDAEILADDWRSLISFTPEPDIGNGEDSTGSKGHPESEEDRISSLYRSAPYVRFLTLDELIECIDVQPEAIRRRERRIAVRTELLHKKNDYYRYTAPSFEPDFNDSRIVRNMEALAEILTMGTGEEDTNGMMLRVELLRELGRFEEAAEALNRMPVNARSIPLFETMGRLIQAGDSRIYEYSGETGEPVPPEEYTSTALLYACRTGDLDLVTFFAEKAGQEEMNEAICSISIYEDTALPVIRILHKMGADISTQDESGKTLLHYAIEEAEFSIAKKLLEMGIDADSVDKCGNTPLILTADSWEESPDLVTELLRRGIDINCQNSWGKTAYSAAKSGKHTQIMTILADAGADTSPGPEKDEEEDSDGIRWI